VVIAAGPLGDALFLAGIWFLTPAILVKIGYPIPQALLGQHLYFYVFGWITLLYWIPGTATLYGRKLPTDSLQLWNIFRSKPIPKSLLHASFEKTYIHCFHLVEQNRKMEAARFYLKAKKRGRLGTDPKILSEFAELFGRAGLWKRAFDLRHSLLEKLSPETDAYAEQADLLACISIYENRKDLLAKSRTLITSALKHHPNMITLKGTLGAILAELEEFKDAEKTLLEVRSKSTSELDHSISSSYLAWIHARRGEAEQANVYIAAAAKIEPLHRLVNRKLDETKAILNIVTEPEPRPASPTEIPARKQPPMSNLAMVLLMICITINLLAIFQSFQWTSPGHRSLATALAILGQGIAIPSAFVVSWKQRWILLGFALLTFAFLYFGAAMDQALSRAGIPIQ